MAPANTEAQPIQPGHAAFAVISCEVFLEEIKSIGGQTPPWTSLDTLEMGLHDTPDLLRRSIQDRILTLEKEFPGLKSIVLLYGSCGNGLTDICSTRCQLIMAQAHDCISILLGGCDRHECLLRQFPGAFFYSPGWVQGKRVPGPDRILQLRQQYQDKFSDHDPQLLESLLEADKQSFAHHDTAVYVSILSDTDSEVYTQHCAKSLEWHYHKEMGDVSLLRQLLGGNWQDPRLLKVQPGEKLFLNYQGRLEVEPQHAHEKLAH